jgi:uncharacterized protein (TIGR03086 family)
MQTSGGLVHSGGVTESLPTSSRGRRDQQDQRDRRIAELVGLGRDREAAELAGTTSPTGHNPIGGSMDVLQQLDLVGNALGGVVGNITPDQLDNPTPCDEFAVRGVLEHMIGGATMFTAAFRGEAPADPDLTDPLAAFGPCLGALVGAINEPGALERTIAAPWGEVTGADFAQFIVLDGAVHGYDMAIGTGQAYEPDDALVEHLISFAGPALEGMRDGTTFKAATTPPAGATPIQRLAALTGRTVE